MELTLSSVTIQQVYVFLEVVETGSFTNAGENLHMTQSAVSKSIAKLEQNLGITLFVRNSRELCLTDAGKMLYNEWGPLFQSIDASYRKVVQSQEHMQYVLQLGLPSAARPGQYLWDLISSLHNGDSSVSLQIENEEVPSLINNLKNNFYDVVLIPDFDHYSLEESDLAWKWASRTSSYIYLSRSHPLADKESVTMEDLLDQSFVILKRGHSDSHYQDLKNRFAPFDVQPKVLLSLPNVFDIKSYYRSGGEAIFFANYNFDDLSGPNFVSIPVEGQYSGIVCGYKVTNQKPALKKFIETLSE